MHNTRKYTIEHNKHTQERTTHANVKKKKSLRAFWLKINSWRKTVFRQELVFAKNSLHCKINVQQPFKLTYRIHNTLKHTIEHNTHKNKAWKM